MIVSRDEIHDRLVATYQSLEASTLDTVLQDHGIADAERRRTIIGEFLFAQGIILDQCWFEEDGKRWFPGVYFSTVPHDRIDEGTVQVPCAAFGMNFHEYALGAADWAIDDANGPDAIVVGNE